jgi:hypothetical protein
MFSREKKEGKNNLLFCLEMLEVVQGCLNKWPESGYSFSIELG